MNDVVIFFAIEPNNVYFYLKGHITDIKICILEYPKLATYKWATIPSIE